MSDHSICLLGNGKQKSFVKRGNRLQSSKFSAKSQENSIDRYAPSPAEKSYSHAVDATQGEKG